MCLPPLGDKIMLKIGEIPNPVVVKNVCPGVNPFPKPRGKVPPACSIRGPNRKKIRFGPPFENSAYATGYIYHFVANVDFLLKLTDRLVH